VGADGSLKLAQRVPDAAMWHLDRGRIPLGLALTVAAWLQCTAYPGQLAADRTGVPPDPAGERIRAIGAKPAGGSSVQRARHLARTCLSEEAVLGRELGGRGEFTDAVAELLALLETGGVPAAVEATCEAGVGGGA
jgi:fructuronate reductase